MNGLSTADVELLDGFAVAGWTSNAYQELGEKFAARPTDRDGGCRAAFNVYLKRKPRFLHVQNLNPNIVLMD